MDRVERNRLRARCVDGWKPGQSVEVRVEDLEALLDLADQVDVYRPDQHHRIALVHWQEGRTVDGCACASCEGRRAYERHAAEREVQ